MTINKLSPKRERQLKTFAIEAANLWTFIINRSTQQGDQADKRFEALDNAVEAIFSELMALNNGELLIPMFEGHSNITAKANSLFLALNDYWSELVPFNLTMDGHEFSHMGTNWEPKLPELAEIETLADIDYKVSKQLTPRWPKASEACKYQRVKKPVVKIPEFDQVMRDIREVSWMGIENFCLHAGNMICHIIKTRANANKQAQLFNLILDTVYGLQPVGAINFYYNNLTADQKDELNAELTAYLIAEYNQHIECTNYNNAQGNK